MARAIKIMPKSQIPEPVVEETPPAMKAPKTRMRNYQPDQVIHILAAENPKRPNSGSHRRFELYKNGMTVQEALDEGVTPADLDYDHKKEFIRIV